MLNKQDYKKYGMETNINKTAKPIPAFERKFLIEGIDEEIRRNPGKTLAKSCQLKKPKQVTYPPGLKQLVRFLKDDENYER
jgi:hypothetical protein